MSAVFPEGEGIFETIKTRRGVAFALTRHIARATRSGLILGMRIPSGTEIADAVSHMLLKTPESLEYGRLRITFHPSGEFALLHENYHPWSAPARLSILDRPIDENSPTVGIKTLPFTEHIDCLKIAHETGYDDVIRLNFNGEVSESAVSNLLLKIRGRWVTPNLASGCLPGITRELAVEWLDIEERVVRSEELEEVESIYLLSSLKEAQPVCVLETRSLEIDSHLRQELLTRMAQDIDP